MNEFKKFKFLLSVFDVVRIFTRLYIDINTIFYNVSTIWLYLKFVISRTYYSHLFIAPRDGGVHFAYFL